MRQIKFRGQNINGEWVTGNLSVLNKDFSSIVKKGYYISNSAGAPFAFMVRPESVGQFTGLHDKNGVEIYEGDVFTANEYPFKDDGNPNYNGVVEWIFAGFQYYLTCLNKDKRGISEGINEVLEDGSWLEVIGNTHTQDGGQEG